MKGNNTMGLTPYNQLKADMLSEWDNLDDDRLEEHADSLTPVYYSDIIEQWRGLTMEESDTWREHGHEITPETTITNLMAIDLFYYYSEAVNRAYEELKAEKQEQEDEGADNE
jgi:hypothetical protein